MRLTFGCVTFCMLFWGTTTVSSAFVTTAALSWPLSGQRDNDSAGFPLPNRQQSHRVSHTRDVMKSLLSTLESAATDDVQSMTNGMDEASSASFLANALGYVLGLGSLLLYTPIAVRVYRQKHADGLTATTWWLKLLSYTTSDVYYLHKRYPLSTYVETVTITVEAAVILGLVTYFQRGTEQEDANFYAWLIVYMALTVYGLTMAPGDVLTIGQVGAALLNSAALAPQFYLNWKYQTKGDYSPITAALASVGCAIRLYTTVMLADGDVVLIFSFGLALILNASLLLQILWYGMRVEGLTLLAVFAADMGTPREERTGNNDTPRFLALDGGQLQPIFQEMEDVAVDNSGTVERRHR